MHTYLLIYNATTALQPSLPSMNENPYFCVQLNAQQKELLGGKKVIAVNMPTRWAVQFRVGQTIMDSQRAFTAAVVAPDWEELGGKADDVRKIVSGELGPFWQELGMLLTLLRPFEQTIHQLEGDRPHLADCHLALLKLEDHVQKWAVKHVSIQVAGKDNKGSEFANSNLPPCLSSKLSVSGWV